MRVVVVGLSSLVRDVSYAPHFYPGAGAAQFRGETIIGMMNDLQASVQPTLVGRTSEFDDQVRAAVEAGFILGAGYDTRALRLSLPKDMQVFEFDQASVQERKRSKLSSIVLDRGNSARCALTA